MSDSTPQHTWSNCRKCLTLFKPGLVWRKTMLSEGGMTMYNVWLGNIG